MIKCQIRYISKSAVSRILANLNLKTIYQTFFSIRIICRALSGCANRNTILSRFKAGPTNTHFEKAPQVIWVFVPAEYSLRNNF